MKDKLLSPSLFENCLHQELIFDEDRGEQVCTTCAKVIEENIVNSSKERFFDDFQNVRTGPEITLAYDGGLSTMIGSLNVDSQGKPLSHDMKIAMKRAKTWDSRSKLSTSSKKNLRIALLELNKLKEKMALSDAIIERAAYFYRKSIEHDMIRGRTVKGVVGACLYAACRDMGTTRTIIEISKNIQEKRKSIAKSYRILFRRLALSVSITDPKDIIIRSANNLKIKENTKRKAFSILDELRHHNLIVGKKPESVAATVLYMACVQTKTNISQNKIAIASGVSSVTMRHRLKEFTKIISLV